MLVWAGLSDSYKCNHGTVDFLEVFSAWLKMSQNYNQCCYMELRDIPVDPVRLTGGCHLWKLISVIQYGWCFLRDEAFNKELGYLLYQPCCSNACMKRCSRILHTCMQNVKPNFDPSILQHSVFRSKPALFFILKACSPMVSGTLFSWIYGNVWCGTSLWLTNWRVPFVCFFNKPKGEGGCTGQRSCVLFSSWK